MFIRPALVDPSAGPDGARYTVRDPMTLVHLAAEGEEKPAVDYWLRRIQEGGVEIVDQPGESLKLTDETRAKLPELPTLASGEWVEYAAGVSGEPAPAEETRP